MGKKILLADDSITIQKVIELTFSDEDFEVVTVGNGRLAIERLPEARPDLVLCDIIMPEKDGYEVCDFIKKNPALSHIPVLLLTGAFEPFDQERASRVGCDGFLAKPFEPQTLIAKVKDLLSRAPARPAAAAAPAPVAAPTAAAPAAPAASPATVAFTSPPSSPAPAAATPPPYDRGTGFDAPRAAEPERAPQAPPWATAMPAAAPFTPPAPAPSFSSPEPEPDILEPEPEESFADATGADDEEDFGTVKAPAYGGDADRFTGGATPKSLDEFYEDDGDSAPADLMPLTDDESESVSGSATALDDDEPAAPWAQPTVEVPLETRAQAGVESAAEAGFDEVFQERQTPSRESAAAPEPPPAAPSAVDRGFGFGRDTNLPGATASAAAAASAAMPDTSFRDLAMPAEPPAEKPRSVTGEVPVPVDMVEQIAQRVVAQISEKVIREIAWEVIPDLAEALIRKEIDRLKAELQQT